MCSSARYGCAGTASSETAGPCRRASRSSQSSGSASGPPARAAASVLTPRRRRRTPRAHTHLPLTPRFRRRAEETVQDGDVAAEERRFLLHDVLLQQGGHLVPKQGLVVLPDLPFHLHSTHFIQLLVSHHDLQLLLWHLQQEDAGKEARFSLNSAKNPVLNVFQGPRSCEGIDEGLKVWRRQTFQSFSVIRLYERKEQKVCDLTACSSQKGEAAQALTLGRCFSTCMTTGWMDGIFTRGKLFSSSSSSLEYLQKSPQMCFLP